MKKILVTGAAGFIGFHLCRKLLENGAEVVGLDNINDYYDQNLKYDRLKELGIDLNGKISYNKNCKSNIYENFSFIKINLEDRENLPHLFEYHKFHIVCNLAAQAGVRYSIDNPDIYIDSNLVGFANLLECCRNHQIEHLIYASSSSVYGQNEKIPFSTKDSVDHPISLYAATKKSNELMAHAYSHLYNLKVTGLRFFTVYGPWGRPDMAMFLFTDAIIKEKPLKVFNQGDLERDFTYIDDIIDGIYRVINYSQKNDESSNSYSLFNIGNGQPVKLLDFITEIENQLGMKAEKKMLPMQPGDVNRTWAETTDLKEKFNYSSKTSIKDGIFRFVKWYKDYYKV